MAVAMVAFASLTSATEEALPSLLFPARNWELPDSPVSFFDVQPRPDGSWFALWVDATAGNLHTARATYAGATWSFDPVPIRPGGSLPGDIARIAVNALGVLAVWHRPGSEMRDNDLAYAFLPAGTSRWTEPAPLHPGAGRQILPIPVCGASACGVVWQEESAPERLDWVIVASRVFPTPGIRVELGKPREGETAEFASAMAAGSNYVVAVWGEANRTGSRIVGARWDINQGEPDRRFLVYAGEDGRRVYQPSVVAGPTWLVAWPESKPPRERGIGVAVLDMDGHVLESPSTLPFLSAVAFPGHVRGFRLENGTRGIVWEDHVGGRSRLLMATLDQQSGRWSGSYVAEPSGQGDQTNPQPRPNGGELFLFFRESYGFEEQLRVASTIEPPAAGADTAATGPPLLGGVLVVLAAVVWARRQRGA